MQRFFLAVIVTLAVIASTYAETTCESHRRNSQNSAHGLRWNIECDEEGKYKPLQCTDDTETKKWCSCYNKEEAVAGPSRKLRYCDCPLDKDQKTKGQPRAAECDIPKCAPNGRYEAKQCCTTTNKCHCVNTTTGQKTTEPTSDANLQCPDQ